jgi:hypothetical protein
MQRRLPRLVLGSLTACLPVIGLMMAIGPSAGASAAVRPSQRAQATAIALNALRHLDIGQHATDHQLRGRATGVSGLTKVTSSNWSGYADVNTSGNTYSTVTGKWTEPTVTCSGSTTALAAFWVGIDGFSSDSVEQDGTLAECFEGSLFSFSWWEMYPTNAIQVVGESVAAGDSITASVVKTGTSYALKVTDSTHTANSFSTTQSCSSCANSSAEWIAEAPSGSAGIYPLPDFHSWTESGATVKSGTTTGVISTFPDDSINMVDGSGNTEASTGALNAAGSGFTVTWARST